MSNRSKTHYYILIAVYGLVFTLVPRTSALGSEHINSLSSNSLREWPAFRKDDTDMKHWMARMMGWGSHTPRFYPKGKRNLPSLFAHTTYEPVEQTTIQTELENPQNQWRNEEQTVRSLVEPQRNEEYADTTPNYHVRSKNVGDVGRSRMAHTEYRKANLFPFTKWNNRGHERNDNARYRPSHRFMHDYRNSLSHKTYETNDSELSKAIPGRLNSTILISIS